MDWPSVGLGCALGALVLTGCVAWGADGPPLGYARLALVALAGAAAFVLDDPSAAAADATPASLRRRTARRSTAALMPLGVWTAGVLAMDWRNGSTRTADLLVEGAGVLSLAVGLAALLRAHWRAEPGEEVAAGLGAALLTVLVLDPPPHAVPPFPVGDGWGASSLLWTLVVVAAALVLRVATRDLAARPRHRWPARGNPWTSPLRQEVQGQQPATGTRD